MLMSLSISDDVVKLLSNINNGTNTLVINGAIVPESSWVGTGYYTVGNIRISKISSNSGNVHCIKINDSNYKLVTHNMGNRIFAENVEYDGTTAGSSAENVQEAIDDLYSTKTTLTQALQVVYPVGAIYMSTSSTSPATLFGGTWERITGKFLLGVTDSATNTGYSQATTKTGGVTGGSVTLGSNHIPRHSHSIGQNVISGSLTLAASIANSDGAHYHSIYTARQYGTGSATDNSKKIGRTQSNADGVGTNYTGASDSAYYANQGAHKHTISAWASASSLITPNYYGGNSSGTTDAFDIRPPFYAVYIWRRTA